MGTVIDYMWCLTLSNAQCLCNAVSRVTRVACATRGSLQAGLSWQGTDEDNLCHRSHFGSRLGLNCFASESSLVLVRFPLCHFEILHIQSRFGVSQFARLARNARVRARIACNACSRVARVACATRGSLQASLGWQDTDEIKDYHRSHFG